MRLQIGQVTARLSALDDSLRPGANAAARPEIRDTLSQFAAPATAAGSPVDSQLHAATGPPPIVVDMPHPTGFQARSSRGESAEVTEMRLGATWFNRIGAVILLLAVVFFVKYSFDQGWLGPLTRVLMGAATGSLLIAGGEFALARSLRQFAVGLIGAGVAMLYVAAYSAHAFYGLIETNTAFMLYCGITLAGSLLAVHGRIQAVAILALIGAFLTPPALSTGRNAQVELLTYLLIVDAGFLIVGAFRRWDALRPLCWIGTAVMFLGWGFSFYEASALWTTLGFVGAFYALFHGEALAAARLNWGMQRLLLPAIVHFNNIAFFSAVYFLADATQHKWMGLFCVITGLIQWALAWLIRRPDGTSMRTQTSLAIDGAFILALAAPIQFDHATVALAWGVQSVACLFFARQLPDIWLRVKGLGVLVAAILHLILVDIDDRVLTRFLVESAGGLWHINYLILCFIAVATCAFAGAALLRWQRDAQAEDARLSVAISCIGVALLLGIAALQYDRYIATFCWLTVLLLVTGIGRVLPAARLMAVGIVFATTAKYFVWDLVKATERSWADLDGVVMNRAVMCGVALAAALVLARHAVGPLEIAALPTAWRAWARPALAVLAVLTLVAAGTFEIVRVFKFESIGREAVNPRFARELWLSVFWSVTAIGSLTIGMAGNLRELRYLAVGIFAVTVIKVVLVDMSYLGMIYRVVSFGVLGLLLLLASLFYQKRWSRLHREPGAH